jgi:hypothetical protein
MVIATLDAHEPTHLSPWTGHERTPHPLSYFAALSVDSSQFINKRDNFYFSFVVLKLSSTRLGVRGVQSRSAAVSSVAMVAGCGGLVSVCACMRMLSKFEAPASPRNFQKIRANATIVPTNGNDKLRY